MLVLRWPVLLAAMAVIETAGMVTVAGQGTSALDFEFYRQRVEPCRDRAAQGQRLG